MILSYRQFTKQKGMTLIEVLIASMILFMALGLSASVFKQSSLLQEKVLSQVIQQRTQSAAMPRIKFAIEDGRREGAFNLLEHSLRWRVIESKSSKFVNSYNYEHGELSYGKGQVSLVTIEMKYDKWPNWSVTYNEVVWLR